MCLVVSFFPSTTVMPPKKTAAELKREAEAQRLRARQLEEEVARAEEEEAAEEKRREDARKEAEARQAAEVRRADAARKEAEAARIRAANQTERGGKAKAEATEAKGKGGVLIKWGSGKCVNCTKSGADCVPQTG